MNNVRPASREQGFAAETMAEFCDSVLVNTPNDKGNVQVIGYVGEDEVLKWIVHPTGRLLHSTDWETVATREYMRRALG